MAVNYSTPTGFNGQVYDTNHKTPGRQATKGAIIGAVALGASSFGVHEFLKSESSANVMKKTFNKAYEQIQKTGKLDCFWAEVASKMTEIQCRSDKQKWFAVGKAALIGGAVIGGISAIVAARKQDKEMKKAQENRFGYYA